MYIDGPETRKTPAEFQDRLTSLFGTNRFGDPNIKIVWGQSQFIRLGNRWRDKFGNERTEYRDRYQCHAMPCWVIMSWQSPEEFGTPEMYYANTYDPETRLYITGEYPWRGRYKIEQPLMSKELVDGKLVIDHFPLSHYLVDVMIPMMRAWKELSDDKKRAATEAIEAEQSRKETEDIAERMAETLPSFYGPVSFDKQGCRTSVLAKKEEQIQKVWNQLARNGQRPRFKRGFQQGANPRRIN